MSEPKELQKQVAEAFRRKSKAIVQSSLGEPFWPLGQDPHDLALDQPEPLALADTSPMLRRALAGAALLFSALVLAIGLETGFYLATIVVVCLSLASAGLLFWEVRNPLLFPDATDNKTTTAMRERSRDQLWEHNESLNLLSTVHDALGDLVFSRMLDGRILQYNSVFTELTGIADPRGKTCEELGIVFQPTDKVHLYDTVIATLTGDRIFSWHDVVIRDPTTGSLVIRSIARDVTEERERQREEEAARLKAERQSEAKSRLLATVSHEIRTPLSGILGMGHLLSQSRLEPEQVNYLNGIRQSGNALVQLVEDLLDYSTMEAGRFELRPQQQPFRPVIESVVEMLANRAHEKGVEIASTLASDIPDEISFDSARLRQILFNIIGNAVKFTSVGGVLIDASREEDDLVISVTDTGPGMTEEEAARIFDEFEQAGDAQGKSGGTGLGLAISARLIREFGGTVTVNSAKGVGSCFTIRIPAFMTDAPSGNSQRTTALRFNRVVLLAPQGPAASALSKTIRGLSGECYVAHTLADVINAIQLANSRRRPLTDIIVDHRCRSIFEQELVNQDDYKALKLRRIFLVNPEERSHMISGPGYDSWLIRPLREQSLVDVLCGRMRGIEQRDALNDNRRTFVPSLPDTSLSPANGLDIVLAEDDPINAFLMKTLLIQKGHRVRHFADFGSLATELFDISRKRPDLLMTDMSMPGGSGVAFVASLRRDEQERKLSRLPVLVLTADRKIHALEDMLVQGADSIIQKPVDPEMLMATIDDLVEHQNQVHS